MAEEEQTPKTTSLFAAFAGDTPIPSAAGTGGGGTMGQWLQNSSFNTDLSIINDAVTKYDLAWEPEEEEGKSAEVDDKKRPSQYEMVPSSPSEVSASSDGDGRKKSKKKKRRRKEELSKPRTSYSYAPTLSSSSRKAGVQRWASSSTADEKEYFFDSRGDRDNLAFGSIYR